MTVTSIVNTNANTAVVVGIIPAVLGDILAKALAAAAETATVHADRLACDQDAAIAQAAAAACQGYAAALQLAASQYVPALYGDVVTPAGSISATIQPNVVTNSKLAKVPALTIKGNDSNSIADVQDLTVPEVMAILTNFTSDAPGAPGKAGLVPAPAIGDAAADKRLCADGTWKIVPVMQGDSGSGGAVGYVPAPSAGDAAAGKFLHASGAWIPLPVTPPAQNAVVSAPADTNGNPTTLPPTNGNLTIYTQNISLTAPMVIHACFGFDLRGQRYRFGFVTTNLTWSSLTANATNYLYLKIDADGNITTLSSTLQPIFQRGGTPSTGNGQFTFDLVLRIAYLGDGSAANPVAVVPFGECVCNGSGVTSTTPYAINRYFDSGWLSVTAYAAGASYVFNHNLGIICHQSDVSVILQCVNAELGYAVGDRITPVNISVTCHRLTVTYVVASTGALAIYHKSTGVLTAITPANWQIKLVALRVI